MVERSLIGILATAGFTISAYFAMSVRSSTNVLDRIVPEFCRIGPDRCRTILGTRQAKLFGMPNYLLGIFFYVGLLGSAILDSLWRQLHLFLFLGSILTLPTGLYLSYILVWRLKIPCFLCLTSHVINFIIFFIFLATF